MSIANVLLVCAAGVYAEEPASSTESLPSPELLEFLGQTSELPALGLELDAMIEDALDENLRDADPAAVRSDSVKSP